MQVDLNLPERFQIQFIDKDGQRKKPVMLHRALFGSLERFTGILIEHYAGKFPAWLAPVQVSVLPIADRHLDYSKNVISELKKAGIRCELDTSNEKIGHKIRSHTLMKVPYLFIIGDQEVSDQTVTIRERGGESLGAKKLTEIRDLIPSH